LGLSEELTQALIDSQSVKTTGTVEKRALSEFARYYKLYPQEIF